MDNPSLPKRRTSFDLPKATDAGLAEWASKVKTIQKEVDKDAEDEQRRLLEEIESSRLERARRRNTASVDWTKNASSAISALQNTSENSKHKAAHTFAAVTKLPQGASEMKSDVPNKPISLAAFIGGRATGPYLTKPAPQVNSYDPEVFDSTKREGPHPVFGKPLTRSPSQTRFNDKPVTPLSQSQTKIAPSPVNKNVSSQKPTLPVKPVPLTEAIGDQGSSTHLTKSQSTKENTDTHNVSVPERRSLPALSNPQSSPPIPPSASKPVRPAKPTSSSQPTTPSIPTKFTPVIVPSLARPIQPQVNISTSPIAMASSTPAPAFLRPIPTTEELHPSLTKLQGRGFVEQRVKATTSLKESSFPEVEERTNTSSPNLRKRPSVLDRWQPASSSHSLGSFIQERTKTPEYMKPVTKVDATPPPAPKFSNKALKEISGDANAAPVRLPGMASKDIRRNPSKPVELSTTSPSGVVAVSETMSAQKTASTMASTSLNHPTRSRAKKPKREKNIRDVDNGSQEEPKGESTGSTKPFPSKADTTFDSQSQDITAKVLVPEPVRPKTPVGQSIPPAIQVESPRSPNRHGRIPSTGQRPTVMDVAQALREHEKTASETSDKNQGLEEIPDEEVEIPRPDVKSIISGWGQTFGPPSSFEKRKSSYERYSVATATTLPPLVEVQTPVETPQASLSRNIINQERAEVPSARTLHEQLRTLDLSQREESYRTIEDTTTNDKTRYNEDAKPSSLERTQQPSESGEDEMVELTFQAKFPPPFNPQQIMKETPFTPDTNVQTISIEINLISGGMTIPITQEQNIFYDTEVIVIIYRSKRKSSELVSNQAWIWRGRNSNWEKEERKATELAGVFDKKAVKCLQGSEPALLIHVLGGVLATRQGTRSHWSVENTTMHRVHQVTECIFVDEVDLNVWNLCSAYSYCLSILGTLYVWHGYGSSEDERKVALTYATTLSQNSLPVVEFEEGSEDEMFWMILGRAEYANAHHWKFRSQLDRLGARVYAIDSSKTRNPVQVLPTVSARELQGGIFVIDCRLEVYILIKAEARGKRTDIQLALIFSENISFAAAQRRPFAPPVHVVVLPSRLPLELRAALRFCDDAEMNGGEVPDHMNLVTLSDAIDHMNRCSWPRSALTDPNFLPVGVDPSMLS